MTECKFKDGDKVSKINEQEVGVIKGYINTPGGIKYQVVFDNGITRYILEDRLELHQDVTSITDAFYQGIFKGINDYKKVMAYQRLNGDLTNMYYSMNNTLTQYLPHQFLPVTKFLKSPEERILIADEVGLGKTVEAMYVWKELEARRAAKRLLIVCPAALCEKWRRDLINLFSIDAKIVKADDLLRELENMEISFNLKQFFYICSMESIRAKKIEDSKTVSKLNNKFEALAASSTDYVFNLTIIDEAHYLRNRETANFKTAVRLRDISESLILLSATPIQTGSTNLFSLMNILSPEHFDNPNTFEYMLNKDSIFIKLSNCLQRSSSVPDDFMDIIENENYNLSDNELIENICNNIEDIFNSPDKRMINAENLRSQVFYYNLFNRTRRRFVFTDTATRKPHAVLFTLSDNEMDIYERVTHLIRNMSQGQSELTTFALISRQRQMASCLPAAFSDWAKKYKQQQENNNITNNEEDDDAYENEYNLFGIDTDDEKEENDNSDKNNSKKSSKNIVEDIKPFYQKVMSEFSDVRFEDLKKNDSKYYNFLKSLKSLLEDNPKEKIIVFSFFRGTNEYLEKRLEEDGISAVAIKGGMGDFKDVLLDKFRTDDSVNVLISSEVGSEGLDLQFASVEYNYDLPWNPMRLEQRIGRIDRIGQKADVLRIYNLCCDNTIEDRILERLYERVKIFENSIGDMEDIVGQPIKDLAIEILNPELTDADRQERANQKIQALVEQRMMNNTLENEAGLLDLYRDMVLNSIETAKTNKRCISVEEKIFLIQDFLNSYYTGSSLLPNQNYPNYYTLTLSDAAILSFREFRQEEHSRKNTSIDSFANGQSLVTFEKNEGKRLNRINEFIDLDHPIFDWIKWSIKKNTLKTFGCSSILTKSSNIIKPGEYIYYILKWKNEGVENISELKYFIGNVETQEILNEDISEQVMNSVITDGEKQIPDKIFLNDFSPYYDEMEKVVNYAWDKAEDFIVALQKKSDFIYKQQVDFINFTVNKQIETINGTIEKLKSENKKQQVIHMNEKRIEKIDHERNLKLKSLELKQSIEPEISEVAIGILVVEE